ncbi:MAG: biotin--[acetyl-CoA-carboxylase] ligase [Alphaproteobacteria bacterium]
MNFTLGPNALAAGYRLFSYDTVGSTSVEAMALAHRGDSGRVWIASPEQTAGVGRRSRPWQTPKGNLAASVLVVTPVSPKQAATLGFVAGLSLMEALARVAPALVTHAALDGAAGSGTRVSLKWPNDLVSEAGAKIAGILLQAERLPGDRIGVVAGIGVNVVAAPDGLETPATSLSELGCAIAPEELFTELAESWLVYERIWANGTGLASIRSMWMERASGIGEEVAIKIGGEVVRGRFETIDDEGRLVVRTPTGQRLITAGEVHLGAVASAAAEG